jgi:hypothetical protein
MALNGTNENNHKLLLSSRYSMCCCCCGCCCCCYVLGSIVSMLFLTQIYFGLKFWNCWSPSSCSVYQTLHCSMSAPHLKIVPLLDVHQLLMFFQGCWFIQSQECFPESFFTMCYNYYYYFMLTWHTSENWVIVTTINFCVCNMCIVLCHHIMA